MEEAHVGQDVGRSGAPTRSATSINSSSLNSGVSSPSPWKNLLPSNWNGNSSRNLRSDRISDRSRRFGRCVSHVSFATTFSRETDLIVVSSVYDDKRDDAIVFIAFPPDVFSSRRSCAYQFFFNSRGRGKIVRERGKASFIGETGTCLTSRSTVINDEPMASVHLRFNNSMTHFRRRMHIVSIRFFHSPSWRGEFGGQCELEVSFFVTVTEKRSSPTSVFVTLPLPLTSVSAADTPIFFFFTNNATRTRYHSIEWWNEFALIAKRAQRGCRWIRDCPRRITSVRSLRSLWSARGSRDNRLYLMSPIPDLCLSSRERSSPISTTIN